MATGIFNQVSTDDTLIGVYCPNWSNTTWTVQTLVSSSVTTATGGTYD